MARGNKIRPAGLHLGQPCGTPGLHPNPSLPPTHCSHPPCPPPPAVHAIPHQACGVPHRHAPRRARRGHVAHALPARAASGAARVCPHGAAARPVGAATGAVGWACMPRCVCLVGGSLAKQRRAAQCRHCYAMFSAAVQHIGLNASLLRCLVCTECDACAGQAVAVGGEAAAGGRLPAGGGCWGLEGG